MVIISGGSAVGSTRCPHIFGGRGANSRCVRRIAHTRARPVTDAAEFEGGAVFFSLFLESAGAGRFWPPSRRSKWKQGWAQGAPTPLVTQQGSFTHGWGGPPSGVCGSSRAAACYCGWGRFFFILLERAAPRAPSVWGRSLSEGNIC